MDKTPLRVAGPAPELDADREYLSAWRPIEASASVGEAATSLPLAGLTVLELGSFYAAPYGATLLTDLGARVIKVEPLEGEPMRSMVAFPEAGGAKVLQGKELLGIDIGSPEGRAVVLELAKRSDLVLRSFRAGVAERLGVGAEALLAVNPNLMYLDAPGYGIEGPYGHRPAFAPTISAGTGIAMRNFGQMASPEELQQIPLSQLRSASVRLTAASNSGGTQPDGIAALAVGTALVLARYAQLKGSGGQRLLTTMLLSGAHALSETMIEYANKAAVPGADAEAFGFSARYRLYPAAEGWNFLAAPTDRDWTKLCAALAPYVDLASDQRFVDEAARASHDEELALELEKVFGMRSAREWETDLVAADIGCVVVEDTAMEKAYMGEFGQQAGYLTDAESPIFDVYPRVGPLVSFSRSATQSLGGSTIGGHTEALLGEIGYDAEQIADLRAKGLIA
jgi:crotonobetainyl-CoA:carnitine CoA-transferase CaiB-like acyl-CoA transferase